MIYFRCYIASFEKDTRSLSMMQDGAYNRLLRYYYQEEKPLPLNSDELARICKAITLEERAAIEVILARYFTRQADGWHNERADHEIKVSQIARENGSKGGRPTTDETGQQTGDITESETGTVTTDTVQTVTHEGGKSGQPLKPLSLSTLQPINLLTKPPSARAARAGVKGAATWNSYSAAYLDRYGTEPPRNGKTNAHLARVVDRIGAEEAPPVAAFYLTHNSALYVRGKHPTSLLERDCEGLRTEWATNRKVTDAEARQADQRQASGDIWNRLIAESEATEH